MKTDRFTKVVFVMFIMLLVLSAQLPRTRISLASGNKDTGRTFESATSYAETKPLDKTVKILAGKDYWDYEPDPISIKGKKFPSYGFMPPGPGGEASVTFDIERWDRFIGHAGIVDEDKRSNTLTVEVDGSPVKEVQVKYGKEATLLDIDLKGHQTLTFKRGGRYPLIYIGDPVLHRRN